LCPGEANIDAFGVPAAGSPDFRIELEGHLLRGLRVRAFEPGRPLRLPVLERSEEKLRIRKVLTTSADPRNARRKVSNYARALRLRPERDDLALSSRLIKALHEELMNGVKGAYRYPGEFRRLRNQIGWPSRYVPPPGDLVPDLINDFVRYLHSDDSVDSLVRAFIAHYQFEAIHPFMEGNGRVGRLLLALSIEEWCDLSGPWLYMSDFFDRNKDYYFDRMFAVSTDGDWSGWIQFCLEGVVDQATDTAARCGRLIDLNRDFHERVQHIGATSRLSALVDDLFSNPVVRVTDARDRHDVTYPTARSDLKKLANAGIVELLQGAPQITYVSRLILDVIYGD